MLVALVRLRIHVGCLQEADVVVLLRSLLSETRPIMWNRKFRAHVQLPT
jgi:hypothetical protein